MLAPWTLLSGNIWLTRRIDRYGFTESSIDWTQRFNLNELDVVMDNTQLAEAKLIKAGKRRIRQKCHSKQSGHSHGYFDITMNSHADNIHIWLYRLQCSNRKPYLVGYTFWLERVKTSIDYGCTTYSIWKEYQRWKGIRIIKGHVYKKAGTVIKTPVMEFECFIKPRCNILLIDMDTNDLEEIIMVTTGSILIGIYAYQKISKHRNLLTNVKLLVIGPKRKSYYNFSFRNFPVNNVSAGFLTL